MDQATLVGMLQTQACLANVLASERHRHRPVLVDQGSEVRALPELHPQEVSPVRLCGVIDLHYVGMRQTTRCPRFPLEPLNTLWIAQLLRTNHFQSDHAI